MATPQVNDVLSGAAALLGDVNQEQFTNAVLLPFYQAAYREAYTVVLRWKLPVGRRDAYFYLPANTTLMTPAQLGIADTGEPIALWERAQIITAAISNVSNTTPIQVTTSTPHGLSEGNPCELFNITGVVGINGIQWRVHVIDANNVTLNGSTAGGTGSTGTLINGGEESDNPFIPMHPVEVIPQDPPDYLNRWWTWKDDVFQFRGATGPTEVWIEYESSGDPPSSGSVGWDNCQNFMMYRTASLAAVPYDMPQSASEYKARAFGPSGEPDGTGGELRAFVYPMLKEKQKRPKRPLPFRPNRNAINRAW